MDEDMATEGRQVEEATGTGCAEVVVTGVMLADSAHRVGGAQVGGARGVARAVAVVVEAKATVQAVPGGVETVEVPGQS